MGSFALASMAALLLAQTSAPLPRKPWLGATLAPTEKGVRIVSVFPGSTAEGAGLRADDVITAIGETKIAAIPAIGGALSQLTTGGKTKLSFLRGDGSQTVETVVR